MMKNLTAVAAAAVVVLLGASSTLDANIKVTPRGHLFEPSLNQQHEVFQILLSHHAPDFAQQVLANAIWVDRKDADNLVVTVTEDAPAEILPCIAVVSLGGTLNPPLIETKKGDGSFNGPAQSVILSGGETFSMFHGAPSTSAPMKLHVALEWGGQPGR
jgi:hypothetical protein